MGYFQPMVIYRNPDDERKNSIIRYIGNRVLNNKKKQNFLCLSGDTKLYGQDKTLEELYNSGNVFIYTLSLYKKPNRTGSPYITKSTSEIIPSGKKEVYEIELENGKKVLATSEHIFFKQDKHCFKESKVKELNVGDKLKDFPVDILKEYHQKAKEKSKRKIDKHYIPSKNCIKCNNLFYVERGMGTKTRKYCKKCSENLNDHYKVRSKKEDLWYEWEDNILRNFYHTKSKGFLLGLLTQRTWGSINHRASRLKLDKRRIDYHFSRSKMTNIENKIAKFLKSINTDYDFNRYIKCFNRGFYPDFIIGNLIIECDGEYWHKMRKDKDLERQWLLEKMGFKVLRFNDKEILNDFGRVKKCILQELKV